MTDERYTYVWEYEVPPEVQAEFLDHYAPQGTWAQLFRRAQGYLSTDLYRDRVRPNRFLTVDQWQTEAAFREFRSRFAAEFDALDERCARLTRRETLVGEFGPARHRAAGREDRR